MNIYFIAFIIFIVLGVSAILLFIIYKKSKPYMYEEEKISSYLKCPDCQHDSWIQKAGGGSYGNIKCGNCGSEFNNLGPFGLERIN